MTSPVVPDTVFGVDVSTPSAARVYNYLLGGGTNWAVDREFAEQAINRFPLLKPLAIANRRWLRRVVHAALDAGIAQFLDLGSGVPMVGAVHEIIGERGIDSAGVVYVDNEPVAFSHIDLSLDGVRGWVGGLEEDLRNPEVILDDQVTRGLIDFDRPVCVLMVAVLHFVGGETDVSALIDRYRDRVAAGSWLAVSHVAVDAVSDSDAAAQMTDLVVSYQNTQNPAYLRDRAEILSWLRCWGDLLDPGVVHLPDWRPEKSILGTAATDFGAFSWCGVGSKSGGHR